jgi:hypothetical protein
LSIYYKEKVDSNEAQTPPRVTPVRMLLFLLLQCGGQGKVLTPVP